ncbi:nucleotide exchange factor GrpE [candidate division WWE3 bacterium RIFCSPHIGHO2_01_FULL_42_13]|uniref:Protein GrpE n=1 Tax=candidate division WWE3 bacterium RIFCSPHIGHO2_01_FULL_42_13 TaxID=1802617 RepID=A0A1F4USL0_UNCKA|nr:MAG: nucleotide exchange factor GrpE [candidate division WWE3 bacterium RIFCSPHIGHO2_01_FULL_42_13]
MTKKKDELKNKDNVAAEDAKRVEELENNWKRALADYQNLQKRVAEERESIVKFANAMLVLRVLPILDNLLLMHKHDEDPGLKMTIKEFEKILAEEGVKEIEAEGKGFDPHAMEAIEKVKGEEGKVIEVLQKGYMYKNKVLRPARVKVGGATSAKEEN